MVHTQRPAKKRTFVCHNTAVLVAWCCMALFLLAGCAGREAAVPYGGGTFAKISVAEARKHAARLTPAAQGLTSWMELQPAIEASLQYVRSKNPEEPAVSHGYLSVTWGEATATLERLQSLLAQLDANPERLAESFTWYKLLPKAHFSGYYEAEVKASHTRKPGYTYPLYQVPPSLRTARLGDFNNELIGMRMIYQLTDKGEVVPYFSRRSIDHDGALRGKGLELAWLADPMDAYFLHVQGSGKLRYEDGSSSNILYAADNGRPYASLGQTLIGLGLIAPEHMSMQAIRAWMHNHPEERDNMLYSNERYVFFRLGTDGPFGSIGRKLTPMVSLAVDRTTFPLGGLMFFSVPFPQEGNQNPPARTSELRGLGLAQDTGAAIKMRRIDVFCGSGDAAAFAAGHLNDAGEAWMLVAN